MKKLIYKFELSDEAYQLLLDIQKSGNAEYKDTEYPSLENFIEDRESSYGKTDEWFLKRNFGGTYYLIGELLEVGVINYNIEKVIWSQNFCISDMGVAVIEQNKKIE
jgi:hypothetical protein